MKRRTFLKAASGLLFPAVGLAPAEEVRRFWSLDRTMTGDSIPKGFTHMDVMFDGGQFSIGDTVQIGRTFYRLERELPVFAGPYRRFVTLPLGTDSRA